MNTTFVGQFTISTYNITTGDKVRITDQMPTAQSTSAVQKPCCSLDEFFAVLVVTTRPSGFVLADVSGGDLIRAGI